MLVNLNLDVRSTACENIHALIDIYLNNVLLTSQLQLSEEIFHLTFNDIDLFEKDVNILRVDVLNDMANFDPITNEVTEIVSAVFTKIEYVTQDNKKIMVIPRKNENIPILMKLPRLKNFSYSNLKIQDFHLWDTQQFADIDSWTAYIFYEELKFDRLGLLIPYEIAYR